MTLLPFSFHGERCYGISLYTMLSNYLHSVDYVIKHDCLWASVFSGDGSNLWCYIL